MSARSTHRRRSATLVVRLTLFSTLIASGVLALGSLIVYRELVRDLDREDDLLLRENALLVDALLLRPDREPRLSLLALEANRSRLGARRFLVRIVGGGGEVLLESPGMSELLPPDVFPRPIAADDERATGVDIDFRGRRFRALTAALEATAIGGQEALVQVAFDRVADAALLSRYRVLLASVLIPGVAVSAALAFWAARRALAPLSVVATRIASIDAESLDARVSGDGLAEELQPLVQSFNDLLARLERSFDRLRNFSAHLAHELRTPIHNLKGEIEAAASDPDADLPQVLESVSDEAGAIAQVIDGLLFLAYAERPGARAAMEQHDLAQLVEDVVEYYEPLAAEAGLTLTAEVRSRPERNLDRAMVQRALGNLLSNSIAFTPAGGSILVTVDFVDGAAEVEVRDTGRGIAPERLATIFDGVYSDLEPAAPSNARIGLGIGLSIVRSILRLHHGHVSIDSAPGQGCRVKLRWG